MNIDLFFLVRSNGQTTTIQNDVSCMRHIINRTLTLYCPVGSILKNSDIDNLGDLNVIEKLQVVGIDGGRGPLISIPNIICRLQQLKVNIHI
jgi:hypothetical protein